MSDLGSRPDRDQRSGAQQQSHEAAARSGAGGERDNPVSWEQGKWEHREGKCAQPTALCCTVHTFPPAQNTSNDPHSYRFPLTGDPNVPRGEAYARQARVGQLGYSTFGAGGQGGAGTRLTGTQSDRFDTSGQYGGPERLADQSTDRADAGRGTQDNPSSDPGGASRPSVTSKVVGT
jgi:hypothetical protein